MNKKNLVMLLLTGFVAMGTLNGCGAMDKKAVNSEPPQSYLEKTEIPFEALDQEFTFNTKASDTVTDVHAPSKVSYTVSDASGGTKHYKVTLQMQFDDLGGSVCNNLFDTYTGTLLPNPSDGEKIHGAGESSDTSERTTVITYNGEDYQIKYDLSYDFTEDTLATITYNVNAPADYKGLGFIMASYGEAVTDIQEPTTIDESGITKHDEVHYFKIGN